MARQLFAFAALVVACGASDCDNAYKEFLVEFPQKNGSPERKHVFCKNLEYIQKHNSANRRFTLGINEFSDWTEDEFKTMLVDRPLDFNAAEVNASLYKPAPGFKPLASVDWRSSMPPVKNQGSCGDCWAFAALAVVDFQASGSFSEQQLLDCSGMGCDGGHTFNALKYLQSAGADAESTYPYKEQKGSCSHDGRTAQATVSDVKVIRGEMHFAPLVSNQVIAVSLNAGSFRDFQSYSSGVYDSDCGDKTSGHAVAIVGYTNDYWIIRNSWGRRWGQQGYMYFRRGSNLCEIGTRGGAVVATAKYKPRFGTCDTNGGGVICTCSSGCNLKRGETSPCVAPAGTDCTAGFSGAKCCSRPACGLGKRVCTCRTGCGLGKHGSSPCACGTDCSGQFSGCTCCNPVNLATSHTSNMTGGHSGGVVPDARFGGGGVAPTHLTHRSEKASSEVVV